MTLQDSTSRKDYVGDGNTSVYPTTFKFNANEELAVYQNDLADQETKLVLGVDYSVTGAGQESGGDITLLTGNLPLGYKLVILRDVPLTQQTDYVEMDNFPAESHEDALDKLTMIVQQLEERVARTTQVSPTQKDPVYIYPSDTEDLAQYDGSGNIIASGSGLSDFAVKNQVGIWTRQQSLQQVALTDGPNIDWNLDTAPRAIVTIAGNRTINAPSNMISGGMYTLVIRQDATGNRTVVWDPVTFLYVWNLGVEPVLSSGPNESTIVCFYSDGVNMFGGTFWRI